jgi:hypothetical protein
MNSVPATVAEPGRATSLARCSGLVALERGYVKGVCGALTLGRRFRPNRYEDHTSPFAAIAPRSRTDDAAALQLAARGWRIFGEVHDPVNRPASWDRPERRNDDGTASC